MALSGSHRGHTSEKQRRMARQKYCPACRRAGLEPSGYWTSDHTPPRWYCYRHKRLTRTVQVP
jgi:hypothetical protein